MNSVCLSFLLVCISGYQAVEVVQMSTGCFYVSEVYRTYDEMHKFCKSIGATLIVINSKDENSMVPVGSTFLGAKRHGNEWSWVDEKPHSYYNWHGGEPNNGGGVENCIFFSNLRWDAGQWYDVPCDWRYPTACKIGKTCETYKKNQKQKQQNEIAELAASKVTTGAGGANGNGRKIKIEKVYTS
ncbi:CD209 antigen-like protein C isoform X3 [Leptotrombidium deliense]|uniref:CD209 antigen-like protein C isoform X3 n=1 Tax=Leptotrombidium deliense TaxID=299467 RepID=A0A443RUK2_9ACAR|nr:CD209 antigen-like protein C isoform X3 [Leptotrombidium deliense]